MPHYRPPKLPRDAAGSTTREGGREGTTTSRVRVKFWANRAFRSDRALIFRRYRRRHISELPIKISRFSPPIVGGRRNVWREGNHGRARIVRLESLRAVSLNLEAHLAEGIPWPTLNKILIFFFFPLKVAIGYSRAISIYNLPYVAIQTSIV